MAGEVNNGGAETVEGQALSPLGHIPPAAGEQHMAALPGGQPKPTGEANATEEPVERITAATPRIVPPLTAAPTSHDYSLWILPPLAIGLIAGAGQLYGPFWAAFALSVVIAWIVGALMKAVSATDAKPLPHVAIGVGAGIVVFALLVSQRPEMASWLQAKAPAASPTATAQPSIPAPSGSPT